MDAAHNVDARRRTAVTSSDVSGRTIRAEFAMLVNELAGYSSLESRMSDGPAHEPTALCAWAPSPTLRNARDQTDGGCTHPCAICGRGEFSRRRWRGAHVVSPRRRPGHWISGGRFGVGCHDIRFRVAYDRRDARTARRHAAGLARGPARVAATRCAGRGPVGETTGGLPDTSAV